MGSYTSHDSRCFQLHTGSPLNPLEIKVHCRNDDKPVNVNYLIKGNKCQPPFHVAGATIGRSPSSARPPCHATVLPEKVDKFLWHYFVFRPLHSRRGKCGWRLEGADCTYRQLLSTSHLILKWRMFRFFLCSLFSFFFSTTAPTLGCREMHGVKWNTLTLAPEHLLKILYFHVIFLYCYFLPALFKLL